MKLVKPSKKYKRQYIQMMEEWTQTGEKIVPSSIRNKDYHNFEKMLLELEEEKKGTKGFVPSITFWAYDEKIDKIVGAVNIRCRLNYHLLQTAGHIGDGVRPSQRRKGYATEMIRLAMEECRKLEIKNILMVCDKENIGSAKSIQKNGGRLENEIRTKDGKIDQRYWIFI